MPGVTGGSLERDAEVLRSLTRASAIMRELVCFAEQQEVLGRVALVCPAAPSTLLQLAAVAHGLDDGLGERLANARQQLVAWSSRDPWTVEPDEADTLRLAALVCLEQIDYRSFVSAYELPMVLRDALTDPEDCATIAAMVRWESLDRLAVTTPDHTLRTWQIHVASFERGWQGWDPAEYRNTLDVRGHLQRFAAALSWAGQAQWREHIEPVDEAFGGCSERQEIPLTLTLDAQPGGWWRYRLPIGAAAAPGWPTWPIASTDYVTRRGRGLGTISDVWDLAERPDGLRAMTGQELSRWARLCARQAERAARLQRGGSWWTVQHERVGHEQQRRAVPGK